MASLVRVTFFKGLFALLPMVITLALINFFFNLGKSWLEPVYRYEPYFLQKIPHSEIIVVLCVIFLVGMVMQLFAITHLFDTIESSIVKRIPLFGQVYFGVKQLTGALNPDNTLSFKQVVYVPFFNQTYALGFLTNDVLPAHAPDDTQVYVSVFVPTTPNPTTGYYLVVPLASCKMVSITRQQAMTLIISGGLVQPDVQ